MMKSHRAWFLTGLICTLSSASFAILEPWDAENDPNNFDPTYERKAFALPTSGEVSQIPWSDTYWPAVDGGLAHRWGVWPSYEMKPEFDQEQANSSQYVEDYNAKLQRHYETQKNYQKFFPYANDALEYSSYSLEEMKQYSPDAFSKMTSPIERFGFLSEDGRITNRGTLFDSLLYFERNHLEKMRQKSGGQWRGWEGLCNGWALASILHPEPKSVVATRSDLNIKVAFASSDIKGLLASFYQQKLTDFYSGKIHLNYQGLGTRCGNRPTQTVDAHGVTYTEPCEDLNAGAFHLVLTNEIGLRQKSFIMDMDNTSQVWNHPIAGYSFKYETNQRGNVVRYERTRNAHPHTQSEVRVYLKMTYQQETDHQQKSLGDDRNRALLGVRVYQYRLELGANDEILGGTWESKDHPDFAWRTEKIPFDGFFKHLEQLVPGN